MNRPIVRLYGLVFVLFAVLIAFTSRWTIFEASSLRTNTLNERGLLQQQRIDRGEILAADGTVLARSVRGVGRHLHASLSHRRAVHRRGRLLLPRTAARRAWSATAAPRWTARRARACRASSTSSKDASRRATRCSPRCSPAAQRAAISALGEHEGAVVALAPENRGGRGDGLHAELQRERARLAKRLRTDHARAGLAAGQPRAPDTAMRPARRSRW